MKIGLACYEFKNNDIPFNISQMEKVLKCAQEKVDLLCFGETFLQGFDALCWNYETDKDLAISTDSEVMRRFCSMTTEYKVDLLFGYIERSGDGLYSSCAVIENGELAHNYRRISRGWKEYTRTDGHYKEGADTDGFLYHGEPMKIALCGDLWEYPEQFKTDGLLIWPIYVNFGLDEWPQREKEYAQQAHLAAHRTLMVNSISQTPISHGGAFYFVGGSVEKKLDYDTEDILMVEV